MLYADLVIDTIRYDKIRNGAMKYQFFQTIEMNKNAKLNFSGLEWLHFILILFHIAFRKTKLYLPF